MVNVRRRECTALTHSLFLSLSLSVCVRLCCVRLCLWFVGCVFDLCVCVSLVCGLRLFVCVSLVCGLHLFVCLSLVCLWVFSVAIAISYHLKESSKAESQKFHEIFDERAHSLGVKKQDNKTDANELTHLYETNRLAVLRLN